MYGNAERPTRRVVIGLEPAMLDAAALAAAARLALGAGAELAALFVEDINLLRLASLPFAQEMGAASAARRRLAAGDIERALKVQALQLKRALAEAAQRLELQWTFEVARGQGLRALLEWSGASDVVVLAGGAGRPSWQPALEGLLRKALSYERTVPGCVAVALGSGPDAMRVLSAAYALAKAGGAELVLLTSGESDRAPEIAEHAKAWLGARGAAGRFAPVPEGDLTRIARLLAYERAHALFCPGADSGSRSVEIAALASLINCPLILVK